MKLSRKIGWVLCVVVLSCLGLVVHSAVDIPVEWQGKIDSFSAFFAEDDSARLDQTGYPTGLYLPLIGNGYLSHAKGVRSDTMFISGVYNGETTSPSHRAALPATLAISIEKSSSLGVLLDVGEGAYLRRGLLADGSSSYELRWYAHRTLRNIYVMELVVNVGAGKDSVNLDLTSNTLKKLSDFTEVSSHPFNEDRTDSICQVTTIAETPNGPTPTVCVVSDRVPSTMTIDKSQSGQTHTFLWAARTSLDVDSTSTDAIETATISDYKHAANLAREKTLYSTHVAGWNDLWTSGIEIGGRPDVSIAINASLFAILSSVRDDWHYGLAPGGLTNYYNGHSFWDTETWMYPPLLLLHPEISRSLIQYRFDRLDGARAKAQSYSPPWAGTMFPWESAFSGVETCPTFAATGLREDHISGDIALGVWQEWSLRRDEEWLRTIGYPILSGVADFWVSRATYETDSQGLTAAHIKNIIPPDEYVDHVNDSVYSNFVAAQALRFAAAAAEALNVTCASCSQYEKLADDLVILFDAAQGIHPEYEGYSGDLIKQADVVLLHYPLSMSMTEDVRRADLEYYSTRTDLHGPAMTWGMHSIGFLDLDDSANAGKYFNMSFQDNMHAPLQVWTETPDGNAVNFITGAGGFLQTMINGYPGLRITNDGLLFAPRCPDGATYVKLRNLSYLNTFFDLFYTCDALTGKSDELVVTPQSTGHFAIETSDVHSTPKILASSWRKHEEIRINLKKHRSETKEASFRLRRV